MMKLYNRIRALLDKKQVFEVPVLNRVFFSKDLEQSQTKFPGHKVVKSRLLRSLRFVVCGK